MALAYQELSSGGGYREEYLDDASKNFRKILTLGKVLKKSKKNTKSRKNFEKNFNLKKF